MQDLNIFTMFWSAGFVVKFVMLSLLTFSGLSWYIVYQKHQLFKELKEASIKFSEIFWNSPNLAEAFNSTQNSPSCPEGNLFIAGYSELQKFDKIDQDTGKTLEMRLAGMDNLKRILRKTAAIESAKLDRSLTFLATTGSATPFVGLFGTVWGIMVSFKEIGIHGSASLAVVAPGISEALVATAAGLAVAIPAVIFYNYFSQKLGDVENNMANFSTDFLNLVERDLLNR